MTIDTLHPLSNATVNVTVEVRLAGSSGFATVRAPQLVFDPMEATALAMALRRNGAGVLAPDRANAVADLLDAAIDRAAALAIEAGDPA